MISPKNALALFLAKPHSKIDLNFCIRNSVFDIQYSFFYFNFSLRLSA